MVRRRTRKGAEHGLESAVAQVGLPCIGRDDVRALNAQLDALLDDRKAASIDRYDPGGDGLTRCVPQPTPERFTLFAPEQVENLYIGPLDFAPTPTPISLVDFKSPDFDRFPRFREALANARVAELEPGDAIYMPPLWWHHVESLSGLNVLVNYWWGAAADAPKQAFEKLVAGLRERA